MEEPTQTPENETVKAGGIASQVSGNQVEFGPGLAQIVSAQEDLILDRSVALVARAGGSMQVSNSVAGACVAGKDAQVSNSGAQIIVSGGNMELTNGGAQVMVVGGDLHLNKGGAQVMVAGADATVNNGFVGMIISQKTVLGEGSRVLLDTPQAIAFGAALGVVSGLVSWLLKRQRNHHHG